MVNSLVDNTVSPALPIAIPRWLPKPPTPIPVTAVAVTGNCLRACSGGSAQWRLRPPAADLWGDHEASWTELHLMNVLLGSVLLHK